jgi:hypothetical protein
MLIVLGMTATARLRPLQNGFSAVAALRALSGLLLLRLSRPWA